MCICKKCILKQIWFGAFLLYLCLMSRPAVYWCMRAMAARHTFGSTRRRLLFFCGPKNRGLSWLEHDFSRGHSHVGGRGCVRCFCNNGPLLQVSRSTQKLLALSKVSEQKNQGSDPRFFSASGFGLLFSITLVYLREYVYNIRVDMSLVGLFC